jgi:L-fuculose-phosphate aldolase
MDLAKNLCRQIQSAGKRLSKKQLVAGSDGNISVRFDQERILITPSGLPLYDLDTDDIVMLSLDGTTTPGRLQPSSEAAAHIHFYRERPDVAAVVHAHPPYVTAFAVAGQVPEWRSLPEMVVLVGPVAHTPYAPPGTTLVPDALRPFTPDHNAFVLSNHGLITVGRSLDQAMARLEHVEHAARILYLSRFLGPPQRLAETELERLEALRRELDDRSDSKER